MLEKIKKKLQTEEIVFLNLKVIPGSRQNSFGEEMTDGTLKISIKGEAEKGEANRELEKYLSRVLEVSPDHVKIVSGKKGRKKRIKITPFYK